MTTSPNKLYENRVRKLARKHGYILRKSHQRKFVPNSNNYGHYMLMDDMGRIVVGSRFDARLEEIDRYLHRGVMQEGIIAS